MDYPKLFLKIFLITLIFTFCFADGIKKKNATLAILFCVLPGGGQFYTERYIPGTIIGSTELVLGYFSYKYHKEGNYEQKNSFLWWYLFVFGYSLADAYVGAKMYGFDIETDIDKVSLKFTWQW
jgi:hypothetical protein